MLSKVHGHLFVLGMLFFLIVALFAKHPELEGHKSFRNFWMTYNPGNQILILGLLELLS